MADRIQLSGLRVRGRHGVYDVERRDGQDFLVDATLWLDSRPAAASDDLADTVDYGVLAERIAAVVGGEPVNLIETLAARLAELCMRRRAGGRGRGHRAQAAGPDRPRVRRRRGDRAAVPPVSRAVLSIGSNLGDRLAHLRSVVAALDPVAVSSVYETAPWGGVEQDDYLNAVVVVEDAGTDAYGWLGRAHELEAAAGRVRDVRWGPRTLDVDVIDVDGDRPHRSRRSPCRTRGRTSGRSCWCPGPRWSRTGRCPRWTRPASAAGPTWSCGERAARPDPDPGPGRLRGRRHAADLAGPAPVVRRAAPG